MGKIQTNADYIRSMSDEELAAYILNFKNTYGEEYEGESSFLEWLQEEKMNDNQAIKIIKEVACGEGCKPSICNDSCLHGEGECAFGRAVKALEEIQKYRNIGTPEECRAAVEKQKIDKDLESHDEKHVLRYCISLMWELVGKFEEWYEYVHGEDAIKELCEDEKFRYRMSYFNIVQELFLFCTSHSGGTSTRAKCKQLGVDSSDEIEFSFGDDEE